MYLNFVLKEKSAAGALPGGVVLHRTRQLVHKHVFSRHEWVVQKLQREQP